jgi:tetratricopeptide (TPR) repeat protein
MRKFVRRHWLPLSAGALLFLIVLASAIGLAWEAGQVKRQARTTAAVKDFVLDLFQKANPEYTNGKMPTMRDAVDLGAKRLDTIPASEPELRAELQVTLGMIYQQLGMPQQAYDMHAAALAVLKAHSPDPLLTVRAERFEAVEVGNLGDFVAAKALSDDALDRMHRLRRPPLSDLVHTLDTANYVAIHRADLAEQKRLSDEAIAALQAADADGAEVDEEIRAMALAMKADYLRKSHDDATAVEYYKRVWSLKISPQTRSAYGMMLGVSLQNLGRFEEAADYLGQTWDSTKQVYGESNSRSLRIGQVFVINEAYAGHIRRATEHMASLLDANSRQSPPHEDVAAEIQLNYGEMLTSLEQYGHAVEHIQVTIAYCKAHPNGQADLYAEAESALGYVELSTNRLADAQASFERSLRIAADHKLPDTSATNARLAYAHALQNDLDDALRLAKQARDDAIHGGGEKSFDTADVHFFYGRILEMAERPREAEAEYRASLALHAALLPPDGLHFYSAESRFALGKLLARDPTTRKEGRKLLGQAVALRENTLGADNAHTQQAKQELAKLASVQ